MGGKGRYRAFVRDGIEDGHKEEHYEVDDQRFLGADGFAEKLQDQRDEPRAKKRGALEKVVKDLGNGLAVGVVELKSADRSWAVSKARTMIAYVLVRRQGYGLGEVAKYFARDAATVGTLIARLGERMAKDEELRREIARLTRKVERLESAPQSFPFHSLSPAAKKATGFLTQAMLFHNSNHY